MTVDFDHYFNDFSNNEVHRRTVRVAKFERKISVLLVYHLREIYQRRIWAEMGHGSLQKYCIKELGYSEHQTQRRMAALHLIHALPELSEKIIDGKMNLTTMGQASTYFNQLAKQENRKISIEEKRKVLSKIEGKTAKETERELAKLSPNVNLILDSNKYIAEDKILNHAVFDQALMDKLSRLKNLLGNSLPTNPTQCELLHKVADLALAKIDPLSKKDRIIKKSEKNKAPSNRLIDASQRVEIPAHTKRLVWRRDKSQCTFVNPITKKRCDCRFGLQIDHIIPIAKGGNNEPENLRLLCRAHNQLMAVKEFGVKKMNMYVKTLVAPKVSLKLKTERQESFDFMT